MEPLHDMSQAEHHLERSILWGIYALLATPLLFSNDFLFPAMTPKLLWLFLFAEVTCVLSVWLWFTKPSTRPKFLLPVLFFFLFLVVMAVASLTGVYPQNSFWGSLETNTGLLVWFHGGLVLLSLLTVARSPQAWIKIAMVSTVIGLCVSLLHLVSLFPETIIVGFNSGSTLGNSSFLGTYLLFELFFAATIIFNSQGKKKTFGWIALGIFLFTLFSTDALAATVSVVGGALLFGTLLLIANNKRGARVAGIFMTAFLTFLFILTTIFAFHGGSTLHSWIVERGTASRFVVADIAWKAFLERPLLGWGPENFRFAFLTHFDPCFGGPACGGNILFDRAHNVLLDMLVSVGIIGLVAYVLLWGSLARTLWKVVQEEKISIPTAALVASVLAAYFIQNLIAFDTAVSLLLFVFVFAFIVGQVGAQQTHKKSASFFPVIATILLPVALFFFVLQPLRAVASVKVAATSTGTLQRFGAYQTAVSLSPLGRDVRRNFLALQTANLLWSYDPATQAELVATLKPYFVEEVALAESGLRETLQQSPNDLRAYLYLVKLLHAYGRLYDPQAIEEARSVLAQARALNPNQVIFFWVDVGLHLQEGDLEEAQMIAQEAMALAPNHATTIENDRQLKIYLSKDGPQEIDPSEFNRLLLQFYLD